MRPKPLSKQRILEAQDKTLSNMAAARHLGVSYQTYKKYSKSYSATKEGFKTLFDQHKNQCGKGVPKFLGKSTGKEPKIIDIIEGKLSPAGFDPKMLRNRLIRDGFVEEKCSICGFNERRVVDYKVPLLMNFRDGNKNNYRLDNIELLCYNHYFLQIGDVFNASEEIQIETKVEKFNTTEAVDFELSDYHLERLKELGLDDHIPNNDEDDANDLISRYE